MMAWMVRAIDVLEPGAKYVGLCLGAALLVLPEALQRAIHTLLRRAFRHPAGKVHSCHVCVRVHVRVRCVLCVVC
jgi:hypothetical protein